LDARASEAPHPQAAKVAYEAIAPVYDNFTAHHDYPLWTGHLLEILEAHELRGRRLLDVACGTGKSFLPMLERGWQVTACDISPSMLERARDKVGDAVLLSVADMRELPRLGEFDLVWALGDAVNYLLSDEELRAAFATMRENLTPDGLLLFDTNTLRMYRTFFADTAVVANGEKKLVWEGRASPDIGPGHVCESRFHVEAGGDTSGIHVHLQRHFSENDVRDALEKSGLRCLDVFGHGLDGVPEQPLDPNRHTKAIFIARIANDTA
jgi:SAM-dependent methyltransferase